MSVQTPLFDFGKVLANTATSGSNVQTLDFDKPLANTAISGSNVQTLEQQVHAWLNRTPEEVEAGRAELLASSREPRPLPPGKTLEEVVVGQVPGSETEEEIIALLKDL